ncbi:MAG TPA: long-chain fatty acid--CoA ligase [Rhodoblastus sp.]|nr:long-chain fatty acid--CoA ligase [Rhodoblastus sp.]
MSVANLARAVLDAPAFAQAKAGEFGDAPLSSDDIASAAQRIAEDLRAAGATANEPVVLFVSNTPRDVVAFLGIWLAGCVAAPIHAATPAPAVEGLITRLGARLAVRAGAIERLGASPPPARPLLDGAALIVFTSGSTGQPKGVVVTHAGLAWKLGALARLIAPTSADVVVVPLQLTFIFGIWVSLLSLMSGARLMLAPKFSAAALTTHGHEITILAAVPTLLRALVADENVRAPKLAKILTGGEPFSPALADKLAALFPQAGVFDLFGLTETGSCDFCVRPEDQISARGTIGRPTEGVAFRIAEQPALGLAAGIGELQIRTPAVMAGYLDDPAQTAAAFVDGYFRTGDLATIRADGAVQLVGRSKDVVSRGGNKIAPLEIENLFAQHESVAAVLAFGAPDARLGESLHLMVVARDPGLSEADLRAWAKDRLERFKTPDAFHFVDALPTGRTGKADRAAARLFLETRGA